jgi:WD40 repeat protein
MLLSLGTKRVHSYVVSETRSKVLIIDDNGIADITDLTSGKTTRPRQKYALETNVLIFRGIVSFSADASSVAMVSDDYKVHILDAATGEEQNVLVGYSAPIYSVSFARDGRFVTASLDGTIRICNVNTSKTNRVLQTDLYVAAPAPVLTPDGRSVIAPYRQATTLRIWDLNTGEVLGGLEEPAIISGGNVFSKDGKRVVTISDTVAEVREFPTLRLVVKITLPEDNLASAAYYKGGGIATTNTSHQDSISSAVFDGSGGKILTASHDKTARLWDAATGETLGGFFGHAGSLSGGTFSQDGRRVITVSLDNTVRTWPIDVPRGNKLIAFARVKFPQEMTCFEQEQFMIRRKGTCPRGTNLIDEHRAQGLIDERRPEMVGDKMSEDDLATFREDCKNGEKSACAFVNDMDKQLIRKNRTQVG